MLKYTTLRIFYIEDIIFCPFMDSFGADATPNNYHTRTSEKLNRGKRASITAPSWGGAPYKENTTDPLLWVGAPIIKSISITTSPSAIIAFKSVSLRFMSYSDIC